MTEKGGIGMVFYIREDVRGCSSRTSSHSAHPPLSRSRDSSPLQGSDRGRLLSFVSPFGVAVYMLYLLTSLRLVTLSHAERT